MELMDSPTWADDPMFATRDSRLENWDALEPLLSAWTAPQLKEDVYRRCQGIHVPSFPLNTAADLFQSPQFEEREFFVEVEHPAAGWQTYPGWPFKLASGKTFDPQPAPMLGQHNAEVYGEKGLGLDRRELVTLRSAGVI